ncbi:MAG: metallophosphoesterase, partial [Acidobacteria bacterium]|nr:metallophosphoesterase [Acidobacteriota bacterium]
LRIFLALLVVAALLALWSFVIEPDRLVVREVALSLPRWPADAGRLRLAVVSDIHTGSPHVDASKLDELVEEINRLKPDAVLLLGDFVISGVAGGEFIGPEVTSERLKGLRPAHGTFAVLGNHDWWEGGERVWRSLEGAGVRVLENDAVSFTHGGRRVWLVGLADLWTRKPDIQASLSKVTDDDSPVFVLTHNPDIFPDIPEHVALTLAGHTHGGQVRLPLLGRPVVPSRYGQRYAAGHVVEGSRHLYVTTGVGTSIIPVRFRVAPEIVLLRIGAESR